MTSARITLDNGQQFPYRLKVSTRRRTVGLKIDAAGLTVHVPARLPRDFLENLLREKSHWIQRKLAEWQTARPATPQWQDGMPLTYLGSPMVLQLRQDSRNRAVIRVGQALQLSLPRPEDLAVVQRKVAQWYIKEARTDFARRIAMLAAKLGVPIPPLFLSSAKTRWGSCNSRGEIRLNWRLIQAPPHIVNYVVAHELAHLKEMNHSARFWQVVQTLCPDYREAQRDLKAISAALHAIG